MKHLNDPRWKEVFLLTASLLDEADSFFTAMLPALSQSISSEPTLLALAQYAQHKAVVIEGFQHEGVRAIYWFFNLALDRALAYAYLLALAFDLNLNLDLLKRQVVILAGQTSSTHQGATLIFRDVNIINLLKITHKFAQLGDRGSIQELHPKFASYCTALNTQTETAPHNYLCPSGKFATPGGT